MQLLSTPSELGKHIACARFAFKSSRGHLNELLIKKREHDTIQVSK